MLLGMMDNRWGGSCCAELRVLAFFGLFVSGIFFFFFWVGASGFRVWADGAPVRRDLARAVAGEPGGVLRDDRAQALRGARDHVGLEAAHDGKPRGICARAEQVRRQRLRVGQLQRPPPHHASHTPFRRLCPMLCGRMQPLPASCCASCLCNAVGQKPAPDARLGGHAAGGSGMKA